MHQELFISLTTRRVLVTRQIIKVNAFIFLFLMLCGVLPAATDPLPLQVVTTVAPITDIAKHIIIGKAASLYGLVPEGVNAHTYQPTPGDARRLADADVVFLNGLSLDVSLERLARRSGKPNALIIKLGDQTLARSEWIFDARFPRAERHPNPHLWLDVAHAMRYARLMGESLSQLDAAHAAGYQTRSERYIEQLTDLDRCIKTAITSIPERHRTLLTLHDSWPYFAKRYGMRVIDAIQSANLTSPSARDIARIIQQIQQLNLPAIFGSAVFPSAVLQKIASETHVNYVATLRDDALPGAPGDAEHSYIGMMLANVGAMTQALGGRPETLMACEAQLLAKKDP